MSYYNNKNILASDSHRTTDRRCLNQSLTIKTITLIQTDMILIEMYLIR